MFEQIFDEYRKAVDSSFKMQQELYRQWMNGWPVKPPDVEKAVDRGAFQDQIRAHQKKMEPDPGGMHGEASRVAQ